MLIFHSFLLLIFLFLNKYLILNTYFYYYVLKSILYKNILLLCFIILIITILFIIFLKNLSQIKFLSLFSSGLILFLVSNLLFFYDANEYYYQCVELFFFDNFYFNFFYFFGIDGLSIFFIFLSGLLIFLCFLLIWDDSSFKVYALNLLLIELFLLCVFSVLDLFLFYVFFEIILIPMFFVIGLWGSRERKFRALYLFFFYTLVGSLLMIIGILYLYNSIGTLNIEYLSTIHFSYIEQVLLWLSFFFSFAIKIPLFPFHIWLPEAHVEAPTIGSVLLAGILLKLGVYGFLRFSIFLFPQASLFFSPLIYLFSILGIIYASFCAIRQTDFKRIIAYSSVAHMNIIMTGIFSFNMYSFLGSILQSLSHGFVASALFFIIGFIYNRYHSRSIFYYGGLSQVMPIYSFFFFIFILANIAMPGTSNFIGEFFILCGIYNFNILGCLLATTGVILSGSYSLWLYNRISFGNINNVYIKSFKDIFFREIIILLILTFLTFFMGLYPIFFINSIQLFCSNLYFSSFF